MAEYLLKLAKKPLNKIFSNRLVKLREVLQLIVSREGVVARSSMHLPTGEFNV
jgi:hypothetical protein